MPDPIDPGNRDLDPESLARKLAEQLRSNAPSSRRRRRRRRRNRRPFPTTGLLRGLGVLAVLLGVGFGAAAALPWLGDKLADLSRSPEVSEPDPSFSGQGLPSSSTSPAPENQPAVVGQSTTTAVPPAAPATTTPRPRRGGTATTAPTPSPTTAPTTPPSTTNPTLPPTTGGTTTPRPTTTSSTTTTTTTTTPTTTTTTTTTTTMPEDP